MQFHVFNVENPDVIRQGGKPRVKEMGPFVYREYREKKNLRQQVLCSIPSLRAFKELSTRNKVANKRMNKNLMIQTIEP